MQFFFFYNIIVKSNTCYFYSRKRIRRGELFRRRKREPPPARDRTIILFCDRSCDCYAYETRTQQPKEYTLTHEGLDTAPFSGKHIIRGSYIIILQYYVIVTIRNMGGERWGFIELWAHNPFGSTAEFSRTLGYVIITIIICTTNTRWWDRARSLFRYCDGGETRTINRPLFTRA